MCLRFSRRVVVLRWRIALLLFFLWSSSLQGGPLAWNIDGLIFGEYFYSLLFDWTILCSLLLDPHLLIFAWFCSLRGHHLFLCAPREAFTIICVLLTCTGWCANSTSFCIVCHRSHGLFLKRHVKNIVDHGTMWVVAGWYYALSICDDSAGQVITDYCRFFSSPLLECVIEGDCLCTRYSKWLAIVRRCSLARLFSGGNITLQYARLMRSSGRCFDSTNVPWYLSESRSQSCIMAAVKVTFSWTKVAGNDPRRLLVRWHNLLILQIHAKIVIAWPSILILVDIEILASCGLVSLLGRLLGAYQGQREDALDVLVGRHLLGWMLKRADERRLWKFCALLLQSLLFKRGHVLSIKLLIVHILI